MGLDKRTAKGCGIPQNVALNLAQSKGALNKVHYHFLYAPAETKYFVPHFQLRNNIIDFSPKSKNSCLYAPESHNTVRQ